MKLWINSFGDLDHRFHRACFIAACLITLGWGFLYIFCSGQTGMVDEPGQMEVIYHFSEKRPGLPDELPNLPGYHFLVMALTGNHPTLTSARLVTLATALFGLVAFAGAWRRLHGQPAGGATLLFALLPILQPFTAMVYTDVPAVAFLLAALCAHFSGQRVVAVVMFALACLIRQTCIIWVAYVLAWEMLNAFFPRKSGDAGHDVAGSRAQAGLLLWRRGRWLFLLLALAGGIILYTGRLTLGQAHGNRLEPNIATLHFGALLLLVLGLPFWIAHVGRAFRGWVDSIRQRPLRTLALTLLALGVAGVLAVTFANPHPWNHGLFWDDSSTAFILLRNWPLVWIDERPWLKLVSGLIVVGIVIGLALLFARQRYKRELWLVVPFGAVLLLTNGLVDPRYYITPFVLLLLLLEYRPADLIWQIRWFGLLCLMHAPFIVQKLSLW